MSTEENTGYISNSSERSTSYQRKKTLVTYRIHQRGPHHVNGRKHWLHIDFIREVHIMSTEENTSYISNSVDCLYNVVHDITIGTAMTAT